MNCEQTAEVVSALCDGQQIPRDAAEHIGPCESCRALLHKYMEMGTELRRVASLQSLEILGEARWSAVKQIAPHWWQRGWESMRIPKFAFVSLVVGIVLLACGLVVVKARQRTQGSVLMLTVKSSDGETRKCALPTEHGNRGGCFSVKLVKVTEANGQVAHGWLKTGFRVIAQDGNRFQIGVRTGFTKLSPFENGKSYTFSPTPDEMKTLPERTYWFEPGERLAIDVPNSGKIEVTGEALDHMPAIVTSENGAEEPMDPKEGEFRVISPVLLKGSNRVVDLEGFTSITNGTEVVIVYAPGEGRFLLSPSPVAGAVEGVVRENRITFKSAGSSYEFLMAAPIARSEHIWILHQQDYKPSHKSVGIPDDQAFAGNMSLSSLLRARN